MKGEHEVKVIKHTRCYEIEIDSTKITTPLPDILKSRLAKGHIGGREVSLAFLPEVIQPAGAFYSSGNNLLKYLSANMGFINTKINDILQDTHLIRHEQHTGGIDGYISLVAFNPTKQTGLVILCLFQ